MDVLIINPEDKVLAKYRNVLRKQNPDIKVTEGSFPYEVYSFMKPFDLAFLHCAVEYSDDLANMVEHLRSQRQEVVTVLVSSDEKVRQKAKDAGIDRLLSDEEDLWDNVVDSIDPGLDFWNPILIKRLDTELEGSKIRKVASNLSRETELTKLLNSMLVPLKKHYTFEGHCVAYASTVFSRIAGYSLETDKGDCLYDMYRKTISDISRRHGDDSITLVPDLHKLVPSESREFVWYNFARLMVYTNKTETAVDEEVQKRLKYLNSKGRFSRAEDRAIAFGCLLLHWVTGRVNHKFHGRTVFEAFDELMTEKYDRQAMFCDYLRKEG